MQRGGALMTGIKGKTALVTGSSRGIGRACALELAREGAVVAVNYIKNKDKARETVSMIDELGGEAVVIPADVANPEEVEKMKIKIQILIIL